jgi:hypothetical protein
MALNQHQQTAADGLREFVERKENSFALLLGPAGSGKTFTIASVIKSLNLGKEKLVVACPTHKAKRVLVNALKKHGIEVEATTVSALIGKAPSSTDDPDEEGQAQWTTGGGSVLPPGSLLVLDEISMIDFYDMRTIRAVVDSAGAQAILTGDFSQLRPVKGKSIAEAVEKIPVRFMLNEVMRSGSNNIVGISKGVRTTGEIDIDLADNKSVFLYNDNSAFEKKFLETDGAVAIAYTNKRVSALNQLKRNHIYDKPDDFMPNESVILTEAPLFIWARGSKTGGYGNIKVADNNDQLIVNRVVGKSTLVAPFSSGDVSFFAMQLHNPETGLDFDAKALTYDMFVNDLKPVLDEVLQKLRDFSSKLDRIGPALERRAEKLSLKPEEKNNLSEAEIRKFFSGPESDWIIDAALKNPKFLTTVFPEDFDGVVKYKPTKGNWKTMKGLAWARDYFGFRSQFAVLLYEHASTAHKAQGSTYQHVFVDWPNLMTIRDEDDRQAACYVAVSRASDSLHVRV